jgi:hypothetical protein
LHICYAIPDALSINHRHTTLLLLLLLLLCRCGAVKGLLCSRTLKAKDKADKQEWL